MKNDILLTAQTILSKEVVNFDIDTPKSFNSWINPLEHELPEALKQYRYSVSSWPVIIESKKVHTLNDLCTKIPALIQKIPELYFENSIEKIAEFYFGGNKILAEYALMFHEKKIDIPYRLDLIFSNQEFKILEANIGSSIGGWLAQGFESIIRSRHIQLSDDDSKKYYRSRNVRRLYFRFLVDNLIAKVALNQKEVNLFVNLENIIGANPDILKIYRDLLNEYYQEELSIRKLKGMVYIENADSLKLVKQTLCIRDIPIHGVIINNENIEIPLDVYRACFMDLIYFPDHLGCRMYADKRNLSILRKLAEQNQFSNDENMLLLNHIPWTEATTNETVFYQQKKYSLDSLLKSYKNKFIIKPSSGLQGKGVVIGKFSSARNWNEAIDQALKKGTFVAQEYCNSENIFAPNKDHKWTPHKVVWGAFGFGHTYGGAWVRMEESGEGNTGVINSARGAVQALVFEVM